MNVLVSALGQTWEPFVLILGLLMIGHSAASDGLFEAVGTRLASLPGGGVILFLAMMGLVAIVSATLNLDTSVVFVTPILLHAARRRGLEERAFLYGSIFMANSASLVLLGSNLTNIMVFAGRHERGATFSTTMFPAWVASIALTSLVVMAWCWRELRSPVVTSTEPPPKVHLSVGSAGVAAATILMLATANPALPVLAVGVAAELWETLVIRRSRLSEALRVLNLALLGGLFCFSSAVAVVARLWHAPEHLMTSAGTWASAGVGVLSANVINNLPAAALLSSKLPTHPFALLLGLDLGPNLFVFGAMSSLLWLRVARHNDARPSLATFSRVGGVVTATTLVAAALLTF